MRTVPRIALIAGRICAASILLAGGCAPVLGLPRDPENSGLLGQSALLTKLEASFDPAEDEAYQRAGCVDLASCTGGAAVEAARRAKRDDIVLRRLRALNLEFSNFEERLYGDSNVVGTGGDLLLLVLGGLGATIGNAGVKAALAASSAGIVGAQATINKNLFFQRTIPALMAQMEANRAAVTTRILDGLGQSDAAYPLIRAELDLDALKRAGSIPSAISGITSQASNARAIAISEQANADARFVATSQLRASLRDRVGRLADAPAIALGNREIATLATLANADLRLQIARFVPPSGRFDSGSQARLFLQELFVAGHADNALLVRWSTDLTQAERS